LDGQKCTPIFNFTAHHATRDNIKYQWAGNRLQGDLLIFNIMIPNVIKIPAHVSSPHTVSVLATLPEIPNRTDFQCSSNLKNRCCYAHAAILSPKIISITYLSSNKDKCFTISCM
jgi:hypothetical protein